MSRFCHLWNDQTGDGGNVELPDQTDPPGNWASECGISEWIYCSNCPKTQDTAADSRTQTSDKVWSQAFKQWSYQLSENSQESVSTAGTRLPLCSGNPVLYPAADTLHWALLQPRPVSASAAPPLRQRCRVRVRVRVNPETGPSKEKPLSVWRETERRTDRRTDAGTAPLIDIRGTGTRATPIKLFNFEKFRPGKGSSVRNSRFTEFSVENEPFTTRALCFFIL